MDNWTLKLCEDLNRMLKVRTDLENFQSKEYPYLVVIVHKYATSDDVLFPEPTTLAFFQTFEEKFLLKLQDAIYVAQDLNTGLLKTFIYSNNYKKTIHEIIEFLKKKSEFNIEFHVKGDPNWDLIKKLGN